MKTNNIHNENEFPMLNSLRSQNGFKTPKGYFDTLQNSIMNETTAKSKERKASFYRVFKYAASAILIVGVSSYFFFSNDKQTTEDEFGNLTVAEYMDGFTEIELELDENLQFDEITMN